jgi:YteA family regulatory protein
MDEEQMGQFKQRLLEEKERLLERIEFIDEGGLGLSLEDSVGELSTYDNHPADIASEVFERSKDFSLREDVRTKVKAVDDALNRIEEGTYGACSRCGQAIPLERLEALPYTTMCLPCKAAAEVKTGALGRRPVEEDFLAPPFGRPFNDTTGDNMYDGEDAWQDVSRYGTSSDEVDEEDRPAVEDVDGIPYEIGEDGVIYQDFNGRGR